MRLICYGKTGPKSANSTEYLVKIVTYVGINLCMQSGTCPPTL